jgi:hypothetical protein
VTTSYSNPLGTGDRRTALAVTASSGLMGGGSDPIFWVDGSFSPSAWMAAGNTAAWIVFDFATPYVVDEVTWYQNTTTTHGTWKIQGSNNNSTWTDLSSTFTLGYASGTSAVYPFSNSTAYRYYRLLQTGGSTQQTSYTTEVEFKIAVNSGASNPSTSYANTGGTGSRTGIITATSSTGTFTSGDATKLINGSTSPEAFFPAGKTDATITFDFATAKVIDEIKWYQNVAHLQGNWKLQGSNNGSSFTDIGSPFVLGSAASTSSTHTIGNTDGYRYYRLAQHSGVTSDQAYTTEIEFKIGDPTTPITGTGSKALSAITGSATGTFKKKAGGNGGGSTPGNIAAGDKYATKVTMPETGTITSLILESQQAKSVNTRMALYADNGGVPGARIAVTGTKASVVVGENEYTLTTPYIVLSGQLFWIALQADAQINWLLGSATGGSYSNADLFSDGITDPFGSGTVQHNKAPLLAVYIQGEQPQLITSYEAIGTGTLGAITGVASGKLGMTGTGSRTISAITGTASGKHGQTGTASATLANLTGSASGTRIVPITGTGAGSLGSITGTCIGAQTDTGFGAGSLRLSGSATGTVGRTGTGSGTLAAIVGGPAGAGVTAPTGKPFFPFRSGGDLTPGKDDLFRPRPAPEPQDFRQLWEKEPEPPKPVTGDGGARLRPIGGVAYGTTGRQGAAQAAMMSVGGAARARFTDTVSSDNELLLLAS